MERHFEKRLVPGKTTEIIWVCEKCGQKKGYCKCEKPEFKEKEVTNEPKIEK